MLIKISTAVMMTPTADSSTARRRPADQRVPTSSRLAAAGPVPLAGLAASACGHWRS
jgi:hypothetical protein